ncbi:MAG: type II CRISPR-associated endonuclease Cas1 [Corynebacterium sp.]|uniref:type II CRISPR-associated endonuclease Cas1 n=1 Tax=Corynebacterium sp. TaxID=1720 RepID=UPI0026DAF083|nr:type II CRISPR-associated endonuclease Cas1 [Corynebacterium sp.]MDO4761814.1 type II CRISPR-associated endonuclease Cas1 [Corynebacterium sp.]
MNSSGWQVLDFTGFSGSLRYSRGKLVVVSHEDVNDIELPLAHIAVVLVGVSVSISGAVLSKLSDYDVALLVCDWRGVPVAGAFPWAEHTRIGARQIAQARLSQPKRKQAWARLVRAKITGQARVLQSLSKTSEFSALLDFAKNVRSGDPDNREAQAARVYWSSVSPDPSFLRAPGSGSPWNNALDYGYSVLRGFGIRAITAAGLAGTLGVFHHARSNNFALVDDLIEPFRPVVDSCVFHCLEPELELSRESKHRLVEACTSTFSRSGHSVPTVFEDFAQSFGMFVEGDSCELLVPVWEGSFDA